MSNMCSTSINICSCDKELDALWSKLEEIKKAESEDISLSCILENIGEDPNSIECRGYITCLERREGYIVLNTESVWSPALDPVVMLCDRYAPSATILYRAVEAGAGIYETNDLNLVGSYLIDIWDHDGLPEVLSSIEFEFFEPNKAKELLVKALGVDMPLEDLVDSVLEKWGDNLSINTMKWCDL